MRKHHVCGEERGLNGIAHFKIKGETKRFVMDALLPSRDLHDFMKHGKTLGKINYINTKEGCWIW